MKKEVTRSTIFDLNGVPNFKQAFPLALQHVVAMIVGCVTPAIIVAGVGGLSESDSVILIQAALIVSALSTLLQLFPFIKTKWIAIGSGLPVIMGISFAYLPSMQSIASDFDIPTILGAQIVGGCVAILVGIFIKKNPQVFPAFDCRDCGIHNWPFPVPYRHQLYAGGTGSPDYGSWQNWLVAIITLAIVTILNHYGKGIWKLASILIGIIGGYIVALCFGMVDFTPIGQASAFQLPMPLHFGIKFEISSCVAIGLLFAINAIQAIGDFSATTSGGLNRMPSSNELQGGIVGYGITNIIGALLGGLPTATYSQNVGIVATTKVVNRCVLGLAAVILLVAGLIPKFSSLLTTIPYSVLGGATVSVFASIAMTGMKLINTENMSYRNTSIVGLAAALGMGISQASGALASFPDWFVTIFGKSPVVIATLIAVLLNIILPRDKEVPLEAAPDDAGSGDAK